MRRHDPASWPSDLRAVDACGQPTTSGETPPNRTPGVCTHLRQSVADGVQLGLYIRILTRDYRGIPGYASQSFMSFRQALEGNGRHLLHSVLRSAGRDDDGISTTCYRLPTCLQTH